MELSTSQRRPLRVLYITHGARLAGAELALVRLIEALGDRVMAHVLLAEDGPLVPLLREVGAAVSVTPLPEHARSLPRERVRFGRIGPSVISTTMGYGLRLERHLRRLRPDLVHVASLKAGVYAVSAARMARVPVIWHIHDRIADDYLPPAAVLGVRALARTLPNALIANSRATLGTLRLQASRGHPPAWVIPYPVPAWGPPPNRGAGPLRIGMVGRIAPWKGQHVLIEAFARAFPQGGERLVIVGAALFGETEERYGRDLRLLAERHGIATRVEFTGFRENVSAELASLDILVHASVIPEPFGQVIAEGMAAGVPVIAADAGGAAEIVDHGQSGWLCAPGDVGALSGALLRLAQDRELRARFAAAGRARVKAFSPERVAGQVDTLYRTVIANYGTLTPPGARSD